MPVERTLPENVARRGAQQVTHWTEACVATEASLRCLTSLEDAWRDNPQTGDRELISREVSNLRVYLEWYAVKAQNTLDAAKRAFLK